MKLKDKNIEIVCVSNDLEIFNRVIGMNSNMNKYSITMFDNASDNVGISKRYNSYIEENINADSDFWVVFCHQDFGFNEDPIKKLQQLSKKCLYGAIGVKNFYSLKKWIKGKISQKLGYYPSLRINLKGIFSKERVFNFEKHEEESGIIKRKLLGQIGQGQNNSDFEKLGKKIKFPHTVSSIDCCCLILHSTLIQKLNLKFDEKLDWHLYAEDFCINAKKKYKIESKAVQFNCFHLGIGNLNEDFHRCAKYVKDKHKLKYLKTTCIDD